ncbi:telomere-protecting terminal protein Tpg [Streptomyces fulvorobeus]|nr:hypothetical protein [Streptomyces fulvorobeus]NYE44768.1 hypothetical protein [Streptomyces fulvorobeus]
MTSSASAKAPWCARAAARRPAPAAPRRPGRSGSSRRSFRGRPLQPERGERKKPRPDLAARLESEVKKRWQPQIRAKAKEKAATTGGIVIDVRAQLGYSGASMDSTDEDRERQLTVALPPQYAARLFDAQEQGASEDRLRELTAEALREVYFQDNGRRAGTLQEVQINNVLNLGFQL